MVTLDTFRALHDHDHKLAAYCATCQRCSVLDLQRLVAEGRGEYRFRLRVRSRTQVLSRRYRRGGNDLPRHYVETSPTRIFFMQGLDRAEKERSPLFGGKC